DVYSLGSVLYEMLAGEPPFAGERREVLRQAARGDLSDAFEELDACESHPELADIARRCLSPNPADRPRDGGVIAAEIVAHLASLEVRARESELAAARADARASHDRRARRLILALALAVIAVIIVAGGGAFAMSRQRQERMQQRVRIVNAAIDRAAQLLGRATAATVGQQEPWQRALLAGESLSDEIAEGGIEESAAARAESLLQSLDKADQDRRIIERIEEVVAVGATHEDLISWRWMEEQLRAAFLDYGIDLNKLTPEETAARIRESDLAPQLTDGLELWVGTCAMLPALGDKTFEEDDLIIWKAAFALADPDPVAAAVRELVYETGDVKRERVVDLIDRLDFEKVRPRTLSWLAFAGFGKLDSSLGEDIFRRAMLIYPDDFMLLFDYAYFTAKSGDWEKAVGAYSRCLAIRPRSAGIWRCLGVAQRNTDKLAASLDALRRSIEIQPDHAHTYLDLGITLDALGDRDEAISAYEDALELFPELTDAQDRLEKLRDDGSGD
ncbi:MAG: tetratricopeptide repeat protein, partial [Planctomycetes bacterium]|nr:tetratricopeptide repeat protein [Planctomycetota bacterium]